MGGRVHNKKWKKHERFTCNDKDILFFFVAEVLAKTKTSTLIEIHKSLEDTFDRLQEGIKTSMRMLEKSMAKDY